MKKLRKKLKKKRKRNSQKNNKKGIIKKNLNNQINVETIKNNITKIIHTNKRIRNLQTLLKIMSKTRNEKQLNKEKKEEVEDKMKINIMKVGKVEQK